MTVSGASHWPRARAKRSHHPFGRDRWLVLLQTGLCGLGMFAGSSARAADTPALPSMLLKVKPAVAIVQTDISGEVRFACSGAPPQRFVPPPIREHGTGFVVTLDGYLVTNGHVVASYYTDNDRELRDTFVRQAIEATCVPSSAAPDQVRRAVDQIVPRVASAATVGVKKRLTVILSNHDSYVAEVKAYSPPLAPEAGKQTSPGGRSESGKDVAILKIDARNLPVVPLTDSDRVRVGESVHIVGYPGAVLHDDLLDPRSAVEATVTSGRISSLKRDARGAPVLQTDAAATWGNSGGPAVNDQGEVVGILTFITLTEDAGQAIQGFNFLVPGNIVREFLRAASVDLTGRSPFNLVWFDAVERYGRGDWAGAQTKADAAARLVPNFPDVQRLQTDIQLRLLQEARWPSSLVYGGATVVVLIGAAGAWLGRRRIRRRGTPAPVVVQGVAVAEPVSPEPFQVSAADLAKAIAKRADLMIVDVRGPDAYAHSTVKAKGALHTTPDAIVQSCADFGAEQGIVIYCDAPHEVASRQAAKRLMAAGYSRVAVLIGGFSAWLSASLPLERTPQAKAVTGIVPHASEPRVAPHYEAKVDLPVGIQGAGSYFNARANQLSLAHICLNSSRPLAVGQPLRLTLFLPGEMEVAGTVASCASATSTEESYIAEVSFDTLDEQQATALEGIILAERTAHRPI